MLSRNVFLAAAVFCAAAHAAPAVNEKLLKGFWKAQWITAPGAEPFGYGVYHFRKNVRLDTKPARYVVHISGDNRYRLFVNGASVSAGPAQGDLRHWRFETVDLAPHMTAGDNTLAAVVWNGAEYRPMAQISHRSGFILQGDDESSQTVNTGKSWKALRDPAYSPVVYRDNDSRLGYQYYVAGALERLDGSQYPWGWETRGFDDSAWAAAEEIDPGAPAGVESHQKWQLVPSPVPQLAEHAERSRSIARISGAAAPPEFLKGGAPIHIPPHSTATILIDHGRITTGYPVLRVSGGHGSEIKLAYAEALYADKFVKGNRNDLEGKKVIAVNDVFLPDGGAQRAFRPLWVRSFRFVQLDVKTADQPLALDDFEHFETRYPAEPKALFECDNKDLEKIWQTGWRTLALGAQDTFVSDLSWERIQYVGDTQIHALAWLAMTGDDRLVRQALEQFDDSRAPFGLTQSRFPADLEQFTPLYSLVWTNMVHDYWMHGGGEAYVQRFLPGIEQVLAWYERQINSEGMIPLLFQLDFVDSDFSDRWEAIARGGGSKSMAVHSLYYAWALENAAEMFARFGKQCEAAQYRERAAQMKKTVRARCWDAGRGLFADTPDKHLFSRHANVLAVLAGAVPDAEQAALLERTLADSSLVPFQLYFRFFLARAFERAGLSDRYLDGIDPWSSMIRDGMTAFGEAAGNPRSDCHPWAASPNYDFLAVVAGIRPSSPGFRTVRISPGLGPLKRVHALYPHHLGPIDVQLERSGERGLEAVVSLPRGLEGEFVWKGQTRKLSGGREVKLSFE